MTDPIYAFLLFGAKFFTTLFVLGVASVILDAENDDDDSDQDGGILQPCYVTNR
jgi:hypothetical protein